jgi:hypothetical protein
MNRPFNYFDKLQIINSLHRVLGPMYVLLHYAKNES